LKEVLAGSKPELELKSKSTVFLLESRYYAVKVALFEKNVGEL